MPKVIKKCETCKHEPNWRGYESRRFASMYEPVGVCRFPLTKAALRKYKLPSGVSISNPWINKDSQKHNCPAWEPKE